MKRDYINTAASMRLIQASGKRPTTAGIDRLESIVNELIREAVSICDASGRRNTNVQPKHFDGAVRVMATRLRKVTG